MNGQRAGQAMPNPQQMAQAAMLAERQQIQAEHDAHLRQRMHLETAALVSQIEASQAKQAASEAERDAHLAEAMYWRHKARRLPPHELDDLDPRTPAPTAPTEQT